MWTEGVIVMSIQPIGSSTTTFTGKTLTTDKGNTYEKSNTAKLGGFAAGVLIAAGLMHSQMSALKTISGKKNLIEGFHIRGKSLNDIAPRIISRGENGKIIPPENNVSVRTKAIVKGFKKTLALWGAGITAITTALGAVADSSITTVNAKEADEKAAKKA